MATKASKRPRVPEGKFLLQVFVDRKLQRSFKIRCMELDTTMADQVEALLKEFLRQKGGK